MDLHSYDDGGFLPAVCVVLSCERMFMSEPKPPATPDALELLDKIALALDFPQVHVQRGNETLSVLFAQARASILAMRERIGELETRDATSIDWKQETEEAAERIASLEAENAALREQAALDTSRERTREGR